MIANKHDIILEKPYAFAERPDFIAGRRGAIAGKASFCEG
jgi:hypothetical protein